MLKGKTFKMPVVKAQDIEMCVCVCVRERESVCVCVWVCHRAACRRKPAGCISFSVLVRESFFKEALSPLLILWIPSELAFLLSQLLEVVWIQPHKMPLSYWQLVLFNNCKWRNYLSNESSFQSWFTNTLRRPYKAETSSGALGLWGQEKASSWTKWNVWFRECFSSKLIVLENT